MAGQGVLEIEIPDKLVDVFTAENIIYRGAWGGRGSAKTRTFAKMAAVRGLMWAKADRRGLIACGREFMNSLDESSFAEVRDAILSEPWLAQNYEVGEKFVRTKCKRIYFAFIGLHKNLDSIKSKSKILLLWIDEAENVSETAWAKAIPTVREEGAEIWVTWNPERKNSATHKRFRENQDDDMIIVEMNWRDNPWFHNTILNKHRLKDLKERPEDYDWVWEGAFRTHVEGAYYAKHITEAKAQRRVGRVAADPLLPIKLFCDIGGTGAKSDAFAIWAAQFVGQEIRLLNYYEAQGQELGYHLSWMRDQGYDSPRAEIYLPHDGSTNDRVFAVSYESAFKQAGYKVTVVPNQGRGAAGARIEAVRRLFPAMWFNEDTTSEGIDTLGYYHEKRDEERNIGLGPEHDWSSHCADAFGLMAVAYRPPKHNHRRIKHKIHRPKDRAMGY